MRETKERVTCPFCRALAEWKKFFKPEKGVRRKYKVRLMQNTTLVTDEGNKRRFDTRVADFNLVFCPVCGKRLYGKKSVLPDCSTCKYEEECDTQEFGTPERCKEGHEKE